MHPQADAFAPACLPAASAGDTQHQQQTNSWDATLHVVCLASDVRFCLSCLLLLVVCRSRPRLYAASWGGLADGASPEGVAYGGHGKPILRCVAGHAANLPPDMYLGSLSRCVVPYSYCSGSCSMHLLKQQVLRSTVGV